MSANWEKELDDVLIREKELDEEADEYSQTLKTLFESDVKKAFENISDKLSEYGIIGSYIYDSDNLNDYADFILTKNQYKHFFIRVWIELTDHNYEISCDYGQHEEQKLTEGEYSSKISLDTPEILIEAIIGVFIRNYERYIDPEIL